MKFIQFISSGKTSICPKQESSLISSRPHIMPWPKGSSPIQRSSAGSLASW